MSRVKVRAPRLVKPRPVPARRAVGDVRMVFLAPGYERAVVAAVGLLGAVVVALLGVGVAVTS